MRVENADAAVAAADEIVPAPVHGHEHLRRALAARRPGPEDAPLRVKRGYVSALRSRVELLRVRAEDARREVPLGVAGAALLASDEPSAGVATPDDHLFFARGPEGVVRSVALNFRRERDGVGLPRGQCAVRDDAARLRVPREDLAVRVNAARHEEPVVGGEGEARDALVVLRQPEQLFAVDGVPEHDVRVDARLAGRDELPGVGDRHARDVVVVAAEEGLAPGLAEVTVHDGGTGDVEDAVGVVGIGRHAADDLGAVRRRWMGGRGSSSARIAKEAVEGEEIHPKKEGPSAGVEPRDAGAHLRPEECARFIVTPLTGPGGGSAPPWEAAGGIASALPPRRSV